MASETWIQGIVHKLEEGGWVKWVRCAVVVAFCAFVINLWMFRDNGFKGLSQAHAMDQAQIAREIARGHGFTTKFIRPAALWQFEQNTGVFNVERTPDTYHAPLNPLINAPFLWLARDRWVMTPKDIVYTGDRVIVAVQFGFMLLGVLVSYLTIKRLFDQRLAVLSAWLLLICQTFWDFAISGLPQNVLVFLFSCAAYALVRALEARAAKTRTWPWLAACGAAFGFLALAHGLTIWIFAGAATFSLIVFTPPMADRPRAHWRIHASLYTVALAHGARLQQSGWCRVVHVSPSDSRERGLDPSLDGTAAEGRFAVALPREAPGAARFTTRTALFFPRPRRRRADLFHCPPALVQTTGDRGIPLGDHADVAGGAHRDVAHGDG